MVRYSQQRWLKEPGRLHYMSGFRDWEISTVTGNMFKANWLGVFACVCPSIWLSVVCYPIDASALFIQC